MKATPWLLASVAGGLGVLFLIGRRRTARVETIDCDSLVPAPGAGFVLTRSGRVHCLDAGEGKAVLLFHGSGRSMADWQEGVIGLLSERHRVIAFDYYGCGRSERNPRFAYGYDLWTQQAIDLLDALGITETTVAGHSVGGALACMVAACHPDRVDRVVTIGTGIAIEPAQFLPVVPGIGEFLMSRATMFGPVVSPRNAEALKQAFAVRGTRAAFLTYIRRQATVDGLCVIARRIFQKVRAPVVHLSASEDRNISVDAVRRIARLTGGEVVVIPGGTHMIHCEKPAEVVHQIERFLNREMAPRQ
jgi:pimeloyl-ACP methyl ester carboxylesterase